MLSKQKIKFSMYKAVAGHFNNNTDIVNSLPALQSAAALLNSTIASISLAIRQKEEITTGVSTTKRKSRSALCRQACTLAHNIYACAEVAGNDELKEKVNYTLSDFKRLKDGELPAVCRIILDLAWQNLAALAAYNVTADSIEDFGRNISAYEALEQNPRNVKARKMTLNGELRQFFKTGDILFKNQLDKILSGFIETNPNFYNIYFNNRIVLDATSTRTQIKGKVTNALNKAPVYGAKIEIVETKQTTTTAPDGNYSLKPITQDTYSVTISKPGFKSQTQAVIVVKRGRITRVNVKLIPE